MTIVIEPRYSGPPNCGNGGYVAGRIAEHVDGPVEVTLRRPTPLRVPLAVDRHADEVRLSHDDTVIATATTTPDQPPEIPDPVSLTDAWTAGQNSPLRQFPEQHPFPGCFVCGSKSDGGLHIMVGQVPGRELAADVWTPDVTLAGSADVRPEFVWAALDCSGGLGAIGTEPVSAPYLLGRITAWLHTPVHVGEPYVVLGWRQDAGGRKIMAGSALYTATGTAVAVARATWIRLSD